MPEYVLGNKAKELYRYTKEVTQPVPDDTVKAKDVSKVMRMIAQARTPEEMRATLYATADRLDNRKQRPRFPKSESFGMIKDLRDAARIAMRSIHAANDTNFKEHPMERLTEIKRTIDECNLLLQMVELAHDLGYIDKKRMGTWTSKITDVKRMSLSWLKKDGARAAAIKDGQDRQQLERLVALVREIMEKEAAAKDQEDQEDQENQEDTPPQ